MPMTPRCQPSPATTSTLREPTSGIGLDDLPRLGQDVLTLPGGGACSRVSSCSASASRLVGQSPRPTASSSRVAMSGVLMRPAALMRGATMKPM